MRRPFKLAAVLGMCTATSLFAQEAHQASHRQQATPEVPGMENVRAALAKYRDPIVAIHDGYFSSLACVDFPKAGSMGDMQYPIGGMGVHFLNMANVGPQLDSLKPQVLLYEVQGSRLVLVAAEWFVPTQVSPTRPTLFGRQFDGPMEGHAPIMPPELHHWDLHVWLWKHNPAGAFSPTNPAVRCPSSYAYTFHDEPPHMVMGN